MGYGDVVPVTVAGRILAMALMILGTLCLVIYTAIFANALVAPELREVEANVRRMGRGVREMERELGVDQRKLREVISHLQELLED